MDEGTYIEEAGMEIPTPGSARGWLGIRMGSPRQRRSPLSLRYENSASDPIPLGTGDFESVSFPPPNGGTHRGANANPFRPAYAYPAHYAPAPAAPPSLAPVAMATVRDAVATGRHRAQQETFVIRSRPNSRTGFAIVLAGVLIGGVFGTAARARQNAAEAALAAQQLEEQLEAEQQQQQASPPPQVTALPPPIVANPAGPTVIHNTTPTTPPQAYAQAPAAPVVPVATVVIPPSSAVVVPPPPPKKEAKPTRTATRPVRSTPMVAAKVSPPPRPKKNDGYTVASAEPSEPKEPKPKKRRNSSIDDATAVLKAAMGATENTL